MPIQTITEICESIIEDIMRYNQMADIMDFMGCHGFKRMGEYSYYKASIALRKMHRYTINNCNRMVDEDSISNPEIIPQSWIAATRQQVDENTREKMVRQLIMGWKEYEKEKMSKLNNWQKKLLDEQQYCCAHMLMEYLDECREKVKRLERMIIEYSAVGWNMGYIMQQQEHLHNCYKKKTEEVFK